MRGIASIESAVTRRRPSSRTRSWFVSGDRNAIRTAPWRSRASSSSDGFATFRTSSASHASPMVPPGSVYIRSGKLGRRRVTALSMDAIPRITRAQPVDGLSSQATVAGYKAVLLAATALPKFFPMLTTAAGTIAPAKVFVIGAGVAGLQAIATARRLGAVVEAFDTRPVVKEQVQSLGAKFLEVDL